MSVKPIVFLDVDGVLNTHDFDRDALCGPIHRDKVRTLNRILDVAGAEVVLSSAWRYIVHRGESNLAGMDWLLRSHGMLHGRLVGVTRPDSMVRDCYDGTAKSWPATDERGVQIAEWLAEHPCEGRRHVVIDDGGTRDGEWTDLGITAAGHPAVWTDARVGLTEADADKAIGLLVGWSAVAMDYLITLRSRIEEAIER